MDDGQHILVIDDDSTCRRLVAEQLSREIPGLAGDPIASKEEFESAIERGGFDLVITDYHLGWTNGLEVIRMVKNRYPSCPVIVLTGTGNEEVAVAAMKAGADDYVLKSPKDISLLSATVSRAMERAGQLQAATDAEKDLLAARDRAQRYLDVAEVMLLALDREGLVTLINRKGGSILGYEEDDLLGRNWFETCLPERLRDDVREVFDQLMAGQTELPEYIENAVLTKSGEERLIAWHNAVVRDDDGRITGTLSSGEDITKRRQAEAALETSETNYREIFDAANDAVMVLDVETGSVLDANAKMCEMFACAYDDALGLGVGDLSSGESPYTHEGIMRWLSKAVQYGPQLFEWAAKSRDDRTFWVEMSLKRAQIGGEQRILAAVRDISQRMGAEQENLRLVQFLSIVIDSANVWLNALDRSGNVVIWNRAAETISGYRAKDVVGHNQIWEWLYPDEDYRREITDRVTAVIRKGGATTDEETTIQTKDGEKRVISWYSRNLVDERGSSIGLVSLGRDVTEHKQLEQQLRQAGKMEAIGRLAGGVAHDFNNLLTAIMGYSDLLLSALDDDESTRQEVLEIKRSTDRAMSLTRQLLAFSRRQILQPKVLDLNEVVADMDRMLRRLIRVDIEFISALEPALGNVEADRGQLEQVIMNLAVNARDAMPRAGQMTIETQNVDVDAAYAEVRPPMQPGRYVVLAVSDTGTGMDRDTQARIFEPFFSTKAQGKGTGLGLATVYGIVKQSDGYIWVYSEEGQGTTFKIYLPRVDKALSPSPKAAAAAEPARGSETILLVEDEEVVRRLTTRILRKSGYTVLEATHSDEAIERCEEYRDTIHLMLTDVVLRGLSGRDLAELLSTRRPDMKVIYMSGYTDEVIAHRGILKAGIPFIQKPFTVVSLSRKVREVLDEAQEEPPEAEG